MAINRNFSQLLVTADNVGDWTLSNCAASGNQGYLEFDYSDSSSVRTREILASVAGGAGATTIAITSPAIDARSLSLTSITPLYLLGSGNTPQNDALRFLVSLDNGTTYWANTGSGWVEVAEANILTSGMTAQQLRANGLPNGTASALKVKCSVVAPILAAATTLNFIGYQLASGTLGGPGRVRLLDFRGTGFGFFDEEQVDRFDMVPAGVINGFGSTAWNDFSENFYYYEPEGLIIRGTDPDDALPVVTTNSHFLVSTAGVNLSNQLFMATNGTSNETNQLFRFLVDVSGGPGDSVPVNSTDFQSRSWKAWDGSAWATVTGGDVATFQGDGTGGMSVDQFNAADWNSLGIEDDGFLLLIYGERNAYDGDTTNDYWLDSIQGYAVTYENSTTIASPAADLSGGGIYENNAATIIMGWKGGRLKEYSDVRGPALPPSHINTTGSIVSYSAGTFPGTLPYFIAGQTETVVTTNNDGSTTTTTPSRYYGPLYEANSTLEYDKHWPSTDWTNGLIVHITEGTGAGQWGILENRSKDDAWKFQLYHKFATAPSTDSKFAIGNLVWITLPELSAAPLMGQIFIGTGELVIKARAGQPTFIIEAYPSGYNREVANPSYPYNADTIRSSTLTLTNTRDPTLWQLRQANSDGSGAGGREVSLAIASIVGHEDFLVDTLAVEVSLPNAR